MNTVGTPAISSLGELSTISAGSFLIYVNRALAGEDVRKVCRIRLYPDR